MRLIDADKLYPDRMTTIGGVAISQSQIANAPTVNPDKRKWIPISESVPELYTFVYATCHSLVDDREDWVIETCYVPIPKEYNSRRFSDWGNIPMLNHGEAEVIAWMKRDIPEPYKEEKDDD